MFRSFSKAVVSTFFPRYFALRTLSRTTPEPEMAVVVPMIKPDQIVIDVGAHLGLYTHAFGRACLCVHSFEPSKATFKLLKAAAPNNAVVYNIALSDRNGEAALITPNRSVFIIAREHDRAINHRRRTSDKKNNRHHKNSRQLRL